MFAASRVNRFGDVVGQGFGLLGLGIPNFVVGSTIIAVLATNFAYFPSAARYVGFFESPAENLQQQFWPAVTLGRRPRRGGDAHDPLGLPRGRSQDFVRTARGKGLTARRVRWRHVLHNSSIPIVTIVGIQFGYLLGGTVIVEEIFALPGMGRLVLTGIAQREYAVVQSSVLVIAALFVLVNVAVDLIYTRIDPRVKLT